MSAQGPRSSLPAYLEERCRRTLDLEFRGRVPGSAPSLTPGPCISFMSMSTDTGREGGLGTSHGAMHHDGDGTGGQSRALS